MNLSQKANNIYDQISAENTKLGDLRKIAKEIKKDHDLALELWSTDNFFAMQLAILIFDKKLLTAELIDSICDDIYKQDFDKRTQLADWFMANQLVKDKKAISLIESWQEANSVKKKTYILELSSPLEMDW